MYVNFKIQNGRHSFISEANVKTVITLKKHIRNNLVKTKSQYQFSLSRYVNFKVFLI